MFSPLSPRKWGLGSSKNSPRKALLSPSEVSPFSFSSESLNLHLNLEQHPSGILSFCVNQSGEAPSLAGSASLTDLNSSAPPCAASSAPGLNGSMSAGAKMARGIREYDETIRDLRKDNFNLRLRIYFLEERLGSCRSAPAGSPEELVQIITDLKWRNESLKYEVEEKKELLTEAWSAMEDLERRVASMTGQRDDDRRHLEARLRQLEQDEAAGPPSPQHADDDESLILEVEEEMRRGVLYAASRPLDVLEEKDEALAWKVEQLEHTVEQLHVLLHRTQASLEQAEADVKERQLSVSGLEERLDKVTQEKQLSEQQLLQAKQEMADLLCQWSRESLQNADKIQRLESDVREQKAALGSPRRPSQEQDQGAATSDETASPHCQVLPQPRLRTSGTGHFQVVTQALHIPPAAHHEAGQVDKLRRELKKLKEYAKVSVQERKILLKKIGTLNERVAEASFRKSLSPEQQQQQPELVEAAVQSEMDALHAQQRVSQALAFHALAVQGLDIVQSRMCRIGRMLEQRQVAASQRAALKDLETLCGSTAHNLATLGSMLGLASPDLCPTSSSMSNPLPDPGQEDFQDELALASTHKEPQPGRRRKIRPTNTDLNAGGGCTEDEDDSWSEPDITASRKRMGLAAAGHVFASSGDCPSRRDRVKTFYSLDYTGQQASDSEQADVHPRDYASIIEELRSHRIEMEKLRSGPAPAATSSSGAGRCPSGSRSCLVDGAHSFAKMMDQLSYQLDLSDTIDSGHATDATDDDPCPDLKDQEDQHQHSHTDFSADEEEEDQLLFGDQMHLELCKACSSALPLSVENGIRRCGSLLRATASSLHRLRRICCALKKKLGMKSRQVARDRLMLQQLRQNSESRAQRVEQLDTDLKWTQEELNKKNGDLQEVQAKLNDSYKLIAELSAENLKLSAEKMKTDQLVDEVRREEKLLRDELNKARSCIQFIKSTQSHCSHCQVTGGPASQMLTSPEACFAPGDQPSSASEGAAVHPHSPPYHLYEQQQQQQSHLHQRRCMACLGSKDDSRKCDRQGSKWSGRKQQNRPNSSTSARRWSGKAAVTSTPNISSPDLGVDVGSDPFSSLERSSLQAVRTDVSRTHKDEIKGILEENRQLRQEMERLTEKLSESRSALKDSVDRLAASSRQYKKEQWLSNNSWHNAAHHRGHQHTRQPAAGSVASSHRGQSFKSSNSRPAPPTSQTART